MLHVADAANIDMLSLKNLMQRLIVNTCSSRLRPLVQVGSADYVHTELEQLRHTVQQQAMLQATGHAVQQQAKEQYWLT